MDFGVVLVLTLFISGMLLFIQRAEKKRRLLVILIMLIPAELIRRYVFYASAPLLVAPFTDVMGVLLKRYGFHRDIHQEAWVALILAFVLNVLFWLFIGRYNPVHSSDEIQVIGMDD